MTSVAFVALGILAVHAGLCALRVLYAGSLADRVVALDALLVAISAGLAVHAGWAGEDVFLDVMVVTALIGFTATTVLARFIERRGG